MKRAFKVGKRWLDSVSLSFATCAIQTLNTSREEWYNLSDSWKRRPIREIICYINSHKTKISNLEHNEKFTLKLGTIHIWRLRKLPNFENTPPLGHILPKSFLSLDLGRPIINKTPLLSRTHTHTHTHTHTTLSNKLENNNRTVHVNEQNQSKNKIKSRHIRIDHACVLAFSLAHKHCNGIIKRWLHCVNRKISCQYYINDLLSIISGHEANPRKIFQKELFVRKARKSYKMKDKE